MLKHGKKRIITGKLLKMIFSYIYVPGLRCFVTIWLTQPKSEDRKKTKKTKKTEWERRNTSIQSVAEQQIFLQDIVSTGVKLQIRVHSELRPLAFEAVKNIITLLTLGIKQPWFSHNCKI